MTIAQILIVVALLILLACLLPGKSEMGAKWNERDGRPWRPGDDEETKP